MSKKEVKKHSLRVDLGGQGDSICYSILGHLHEGDLGDRFQLRLNPGIAVTIQPIRRARVYAGHLMTINPHILRRVNYLTFAAALKVALVGSNGGAGPC